MIRNRSGLIVAGMVLALGTVWAEPAGKEAAANAAAAIFSATNAPPVLSEREKAAVKAAERWLQSVDEGDYAKAWQVAAPFFQKTVTLEQWEQKMQTLRKPLGKLVSRTCTRAVYRTKMTGAPEGEYVSITFEASFENKAAAIERVGIKLEAEGTWMGSGYFIK